MKILAKLLLVSIFLLVLCGCSSFSGVRKSFEKAGYTYSETAKGYIDDLLEEFEEEEIVVVPHVFTKGLNLAIVLEFKNTEEMEKQLSESETLQGFVKDLQKTDYVRRNCLLIPIGLNTQEMINAFQDKQGSTKK